MIGDIRLNCDILYDQFNGYPVYNIESSSLIILVIGTSMQVFTDTTTIWQTGKYLILTDLVWIRYKGTSLDINLKSFRDKSKDERYIYYRFLQFVEIKFNRLT